MNDWICEAALNVSMFHFTNVYEQRVHFIHTIYFIFGIVSEWNIASETSLSYNNRNTRALCKAMSIVQSMHMNDVEWWWMESKGETSTHCIGLYGIDYNTTACMASTKNVTAFNWIALKIDQFDLRINRMKLRLNANQFCPTTIFVDVVGSTFLLKYLIRFKWPHMSRHRKIFNFWQF